MLVPLLAWLLGVVATLAALRVRRGFVATLGPGYAGRYLLVQGGAINAALWFVVQAAAGWSQILVVDAYWLPLVYGAIFFGYSLSNIDWTAKKFHDPEAAGAAVKAADPHVES